MLNAFRHHRGRHLGGENGLQVGQECSTPFGITEVGTPRPASGRASSLGGVVLNAFRHHRGRHTRPSMSSTTRAYGAQRLSASQRSAPAGRRPHYQVQLVLNAFRHHRGRHDTSATERRERYQSAQRLSASQRSARRFVGILERRFESVLNAFRHHRGRHGTAWAGVGADYLGCSTPFGITEVGTRGPQPPLRLFGIT